MGFRELDGVANWAVITLLANASLSVGPESVPVIFREVDETEPRMLSQARREWRVEFPRDRLLGDLPTRGEMVLVDDTPFIVGWVDVDRTGWVRLAVGSA